MNPTTTPRLDTDYKDRTRKLLKGVLMIAAATEQDGEQVLDRVLADDTPPRRPVNAARPKLVAMRVMTA